MVEVLLISLYEKSFYKYTFYIFRYIFEYSYVLQASNILAKLFYIFFTWLEYPAIGELYINLSILNYKGSKLRTTIFY